MSLGRLADLRLAVQRVLEQAPDRPLCDVCLADMVAGRPSTISGFVTALARARSDVIRHVDECVGCLCRRMATIFRPDSAPTC